MKVLWHDHTFVRKCTLNALCLLNFVYEIEMYDLLQLEEVKGSTLR